MNADSPGAGRGRAVVLKHSDVTDGVLKAFYAVFNELGHGFLESVYRRAMAISLRDVGFSVTEEEPIEVQFRGRVVGEFRADLVVEDAVVVELKAARSLDPAHEAQLINYLKATRFEVGLLLNFGSRPQFRRIAFDNSTKYPRSSA